jgi:hypothetical protein
VATIPGRSGELKTLHGDWVREWNSPSHCAISMRGHPVPTMLACPGPGTLFLRSFGTLREVSIISTIAVIAGSARHGRFSQKAAQRILATLQQRRGVEAGLLDGRDDRCRSLTGRCRRPCRAPCSDPAVACWTAASAAADGFIVVTPEYRHGRPAGPAGSTHLRRPQLHGDLPQLLNAVRTCGAAAAHEDRGLAVPLRIDALDGASKHCCGDLYPFPGEGRRNQGGACPAGGPCRADAR